MNKQMKHFSVLLFFLLATTSVSFVWAESHLSFAMVSKSLDNPFFQIAHQACLDQAVALGVTCHILAPESEDGAAQAALIDKLVNENTVQGMAVAVSDVAMVGAAINRAVAAGMAVVTFDSDAPDSQRYAYIGTDNYFFGQTLAKVLQQLQPQGGTYAAISSQSPNLKERLRGFQDEIHKKHNLWTQVPTSPAFYHGNLTLVQEQLYQLAKQNPTAIVPVSGAAMRSGGWQEFVQAHPNITLVSGDAMPNQIAFLERGMAHGLVGQLPWEMGAKAIQLLYEVTIQGNSTTLDMTSSQQPDAFRIYGTNVISHVFIPLTLPTLTVDHNLIGNLHVVGFILFALLVVLIFALTWWTWRRRNHAVLKAAQPEFMFMILFGVFLMASGLIPLSFDDNGNEEELQDMHGELMCMSVPWTLCLGFTLSFSALFAKTRRVNRIFHSQGAFRRDTTRQQEILLPFFLLLVANVTVLTIWTILDPLVYDRQDLPGLDGWNRVIATYGACQSRSAAWYLVPLAILNVGVLLLANKQAYTARHIMSEFSEAKYVGFTNICLLQATLTGVPVLFVVRESPQAFYLILIFMIFVTCTAVLLLMFVPKLVLVEQHDRQRQLSRNVINSWRNPTSLALRSTSGSIGEQKKGSSSSSSRPYPTLVPVEEDHSSSSTFKGPPQSDSGELEVERAYKVPLVANTATPVDSKGIMRKSSSTESKSVRWSEVETLASEPASVGSPNGSPKEENSHNGNNGEKSENKMSAPLENTSNNRREMPSESSESTIHGFGGSVSVQTDSDASSWISYPRNTGTTSARSSLRSSGTSFRSSGLSMISLRTEADQLGELGGVEEEANSQAAADDDLPPLVSCTETDVEAGIGDTTLSDDEYYMDPDETTSQRSSSRSRELHKSSSIPGDDAA